MGNHGGLALTTAVDSFKRNIIFPIYFILKHFTQRKGPNASGCGKIQPKHRSTDFDEHSIRKNSGIK